MRQANPVRLEDVHAYTSMSGFLQAWQKLDIKTNVENHTHHIYDISKSKKERVSSAKNWSHRYSGFTLVCCLLLTVLDLSVKHISY